MARIRLRYFFSLAFSLSSVIPCLAEVLSRTLRRRHFYSVPDLGPMIYLGKDPEFRALGAQRFQRSAMGVVPRAPAVHGTEW
jgi:hypothetical protein